MATPALDPDPSQCRATDQSSCASMETRKYPEGTAGLRNSAQPGTNGAWGGGGEWEGRMCDRTSSTWTPATKTYRTWTQQPRARHESQSSCWCLLECAHFASGISILSAPMLRVIAKSCREVNGPNVIFFLLCCPFLATCWGHVVVSTDSEGLPRHISKWFHTYNPFPSILSFLIGRLKLQVLSILPLIELIIFFEYGRKN